MLHPRLALNAITTMNWSFEQDLSLWKRLGLRCVGLFERKLDAFGHPEAIEALRDAGLAVSSIVAHPFSLLEPDRWPAERTAMNRCIDIADALGGAVYGPPGKGAFDMWDENADRYADAVRPCLEYARMRGVTLAFEPSLRPHISFVHNLRDSVDLAERSGARIVVDLGNAYQERDLRSWIAQIGAQAAVVQISDVAIGTMENPGAGVRGLPGTGELPLDGLIRTCIEAGYTGPFEIEFLGTGDVDETAFQQGLSRIDRVLADLSA